MAVYSLTTSAAEEIALSRIVARANAERAARVPPLPPLTNAQYVDGVLTQLIASYVREHRDLTEGEVKDAYRAATPAVKGQVRTLLGLP